MDDPTQMLSASPTLPRLANQTAATRSDAVPIKASTMTPTKMSDRPRLAAVASSAAETASASIATNMVAPMSTPTETAIGHAPSVSRGSSGAKTSRCVTRV